MVVWAESPGSLIQARRKGFQELSVTCGAAELCQLCWSILQVLRWSLMPAMPGRAPWVVAVLQNVAAVVPSVLDSLKRLKTSKPAGKEQASVFCLPSRTGGVQSWGMLLEELLNMLYSRLLCSSSTSLGGLM